MFDIGSLMLGMFAGFIPAYIISGYLMFKALQQRFNLKTTFKEEVLR